MRRDMVVALLVALMLSLTSAVFSEEPIWRMAMHDCRHTCQSSFNGPERPNIAWSIPLGGGIGNAPVSVAADGSIYAVYTDYNTWSTCLWALDPEGNLKWSYEAARSIKNSVAIADDGTVYLLVPSGLHALSPDGQLKWNQQGAGDDWSSPTIGPDGTIYTVDSWQVNAVSPDGKLLWHSAMDELVCISPVVAPNGNIYTIAWLRSTNQAKLIALSADGEDLWDYRVDDWRVNTLSAAQDSSVVFYAIGDGELLNIGPDGQLNWSYLAGPAGPFGSAEVYIGIADDGTIYLLMGKPEEVPGEIIYISTLFALDSRGQLKWSRELDGIPKIGNSGLTIASDGMLYIGVENSYPTETLYALDSQGSEVWNLQFDGAGSPVIGGDGIIYLSHWNLTAVAAYGTLHINLLIDQSWFYSGDTLSFVVAGENRAPSTYADFYLALWDKAGNFYSWPTWQLGIHPGIQNINIPYDTNWWLEDLATIDLPSASPPIEKQARYWFAVALTEPGTMNYLCDPEIQSINYVSDWPR